MQLTDRVLYNEVKECHIGDIIIAKGKQRCRVFMVDTKKRQQPSITYGLLDGHPVVSVFLKTLPNVSPRSAVEIERLLHPIDTFEQRLYNGDNQLPLKLSIYPDIDSLFASMYYEEALHEEYRTKYAQVYNEYRFRQYISRKATVPKLCS